MVPDSYPHRHRHRHPHPHPPSTNSSPPLDDTPPSEHRAHIPTPQDLSTVRTHLSNFLPLELVDLILDTAEYWPCIARSRVHPDEIPLRISTSPENEHNAAAYCFVGPHIPASNDGGTSLNLKAAIHVRRVRFTLVSHDQGWASSDPLEDAYEAAYSWFEASIIRDPDTVPASDVKNADAFNRLATNIEVRNETESATIEGRWDLQRNVRASQALRTHTVVWDCGSALDKADARTRGCGTGQGFVEALRPGDRIAVIARARYPGWQNLVYRVRVEMFYFF